MNAPEMMLIMLLLRLIIPFGLVLVIGEGIRRRRARNLHRA
jgi:hypothetical protein